ncbi:uncharacterized protein [Periplaneta americana]|uniref:uncharacterized protein isoform X3 n=1 Tax=Periplaneta americana TaxID=6978 RepID=UPI0037E7D493
MNTVAMDMIKMEPGIDLLDLHTSDGTNVEDKKIFLKNGNLWDLHVMEGGDHDSEFTSQIKVEDSEVPISFTMVKCEVQEELCAPGTVKDELELQVMVEDSGRRRPRPLLPPWPMPMNDCNIAL